MQHVEASFLVESPLQALNAVEAREYFGWDAQACAVVVLRPPHVVADDQIRWTVERTGWVHQLQVPAARGPWSWIRRVRAVRELAHTAPAISQLFIGDYRSTLMRHIANAMSDAQVVVLDDGIVTEVVSAHRRAVFNEGTDDDVAHPVTRPLFKRLAGSTFRMRQEELRAVTFFSIYEFPVAFTDRLIQYDYDWLRGQIRPAMFADFELFIGTKAVEAEIVDSETYRELVRAVSDRAGGRLVYVPHRAETEAGLRALREAIPGLEICRLPGPIELALIEMQTIPARIWSAWSSAIDTLAVIFADKVDINALAVPTARIRPHWRRRVAELQRSLDHRTRGVVKLVEVL